MAHLLIWSVIVYMVAVFIRSVILQIFLLSASTGMHNQMAERVIRSPILFFDSNPSGQVITRFQRDQTIIDSVLPAIMLIVTQGALRTIMVIISVSTVNPFLILIALVGLMYMVWLVRKATRPMIDAQRFDMAFYGPINQTFSMAINGLVSLRSYRKFDFFQKQFMEAIEKSGNSIFCYICINRWLSLRLDFCCQLFGISTALFAVLMKDSLDKKMLTFSLHIISDMVILFSVSIRMYSEMQNLMGSSQRIYDYTQLKTEDQLQKGTDKKYVESKWPSKGEIWFDNVSMKYRPHLEPSISCLDCKIQPGMKVGIVGRTGAGKSSILQVLFRLSESCEGKLLIDGVDIKIIGLHMLRKSIAYIPQSPFLI